MPRCSDEQRIGKLKKIMKQVGFILGEKPHEDHTVAAEFHDSFKFQDMNSSDWVVVSFPNPDEADKGTDITTRARFNNKIDSPAWKSLEEFAENVGTWIEECRPAG